MRSLQQFWSIRRIGEDKVTLARLGSLRLWLARAEKQWGLAVHYGEDDDLMDFAQVPEDVVPCDLEWRYALFQSAPRDYMFEPVLPARPVLLKTDARFGIPEGESCRFQFTVPVGIRIRLIDGVRKLQFGTVASAPPRMSWFGSTVDGILCYANTCPLQLLDNGLDPKPNEIVFNLTIHNKSRQVVWPDRICIDLSPCGLYCGSNNLFGTDIHLEVRQLHDGCQLSYQRGPVDRQEDLLELKDSSSYEKSDFTRRILCSCHRLEMP